MSKDTFSYIRNLPQTVTQLDVDAEVKMVCLDKDRLYTEFNEVLHVYLINDLTSPIATYRLNGRSSSCLVANNRFYLNGGETLHVFDVSTSLTQPLVEVSQITLAENEEVRKIVRAGRKLILGMS